MSTAPTLASRLLLHSRWFWIVGTVVTMSPTFYNFDDWQYPRLILVSIAAFGAAILCRLDALALCAKVKAAGGEEGRSVSTDQGDSVGQGPRSLHANRTA